ncbi:MAG: hypothetical protein WC533_04480 [Candidatus Pacearchaeota archaeon]
MKKNLAITFLVLFLILSLATFVSAGWFGITGKAISVDKYVKGLKELDNGLDYGVAGAIRTTNGQVGLYDYCEGNTLHESYIARTYLGYGLAKYQEHDCALDEECVSEEITNSQYAGTSAKCRKKTNPRCEDSDDESGTANTAGYVIVVNSAGREILYDGYNREGNIGPAGKVIEWTCNPQTNAAERRDISCGENSRVARGSVTPDYSIVGQSGNGNSHNAYYCHDFEPSCDLSADKKTVTGIDSLGNEYSYSDKCVGATSWDYSCNGDSTGYQLARVPCGEVGCDSNTGLCRSDYCTDSDGSDTERAGIVRIKNSAHLATDICAGRDSVIEFSCSSPENEYFEARRIACANGKVCRAGACRTA